MGYWHYDRLSALDSMFLEFEDANTHMHVGAVALFEAAPLRTDDGNLDFDRIRTHLERVLHQTPRFRQKLARTPLLGHPVWVDDELFNLEYHLRHASLPNPGSVRLLKRLAGRILSQKLDREKPLWEMWLVENVEGDRVALIAKAHHCMVDGISGFELLTGMMRLDRDPTVDPAPTWYPRPTPTGARLLSDEVLRRASLPASVARSALGLLTRPRKTLATAQEAALGLREVFGAGLRPTSPTPLNPNIGPYRRFDWTGAELAAVKEVKSRLEGTVNDVVLATAAGAIGRFLRRRGLRTEHVTFRAQVPVSMRTSADRDDPGNRVVMLLAELAVGERDPRQRLARVVETTRRLKRSRQTSGLQLLEDISDQGLSWIFLSLARLATLQRSYNVVITNIPGPQQPVYLLGARMLEIYPLVPLARNQAIGIALFSYAGKLFWGFHADWNSMPDLHDFVEDVDAEFELLRKAAAASGQARPPDAGS